jgi:hypothetical protein
MYLPEILHKAEKVKPKAATEDSSQTITEHEGATLYIRFYESDEEVV